MNAVDRLDLNRRRTVALMHKIEHEIRNADTEVNIAEAARQAGVGQSTFYRWLQSPPQKIDAASIAAVADWLHDTHGYADFATLWREVSREIRE